MRKGVKLAGLLAVGVAALMGRLNSNGIGGVRRMRRLTMVRLIWLATRRCRISPSAAWKTAVRMAAMSAYASGVPRPLAIAWVSLTCWLTAARCCRGAAQGNESAGLR